MPVMMPLEIEAQRDAEQRWGRVSAAFNESVRQILERASPQDQPALLARAVGQFQRHVDALRDELPRLAPVAEELSKIVKSDTLATKVRRVLATLQKLRASGKTLVCHVEADDGVQKGERMNAYELLCEKAKALRNSDGTLSEPASIAKAAEQHPDLYRRYREEHRAGVRHGPKPSPVKKPDVAKSAAYARIETEADALMRRSHASGTPMTKREAIATVVEQSPELYVRYRQERHARAGA